MVVPLADTIMLLLLAQLTVQEEVMVMANQLLQVVGLEVEVAEVAH